MLRFGLVCALSLLTGAAMAARPSSLNMTCNQARSLVASHGAVVLSTGRFTFERFVADPGFCPFDQYADWSWAPTRDVGRCPIGFVCKYRPAPWEDF